MKQIIFLFGVCCMAITSFAQQYKPFNRFEISADFVNTGRFSPWAFTPINNMDSVRPRVWSDLRHLGITMPEFHINNPTATWPRDLVTRAGAESLRICLHDNLLQVASRWERRYYQVESSEHFTTRIGGVLTRRNGFEHDQIRFDLHPKDFMTTPKPNNGIAFLEGVHPDGSRISGFLHRDSLYINGRYYITLRLGVDSTYSSLPPDNETAIVRVRIINDGTVSEWIIPGTAFHDAGGNPRFAFEYLLRNEPDTSTGAMITLRADTSDYTQPLDSTDVAYSIDTDTTGWGPGNYDRNEDYQAGSPSRYFAKRDSTMHFNDFEIEIVYLGTGDIFIDALCISDPQGYGFFVGDYHSLDNFRNGALVADMNTRLEQLGVSNASNNPLSFLELQESSTQHGSMTTMNYITKLIDNITGSNDTIWTFNHGASNGVDYIRLARENFSVASGFYQYPVVQRLHRPEHPMYYSEAFGNPGGSFWDASRQWRNHAMAYKNVLGSNVVNYIPTISSYSWSFQYGYRWCTPNCDPIFQTEEQREPTAAENRAQVNLALCYGAKSIKYYTYSSILPVVTADTLTADTLFINRGSMGFYMNWDTTRRTLDVWGQNKWDSTRRFNKEYLKPMGDSLINLKWENALIADDVSLPSNSDEYISRVVSERLNVSIDNPENTLVEVGRFSHPKNFGTIYLFVVNKRTDTLGHRHLTVKLKPGSLNATYWRVSNVFTKEEWVVKAMSSSDSSHTGGFTDYFRPGDGALYKIVPVTFSGDGNPIAGCHLNHLHITKGATVEVSSDTIRFAANKGLFIEGTLTATNVFLGPCSQSWQGIIIRDAGQFYTNPNSSQAVCTIDKAPIFTASSGYASLKRVNIKNTKLAIQCDGGNVETDFVWTTNVDSIAVINNGGICYLKNDSLQPSSSLMIYSRGVQMYGGYATMHHERIINYDTSLAVMSGCVDAVGFGTTHSGINKFNAASVVCAARNASEIDFSNSAAYNSLTKPSGFGYHAILTGGTWMYADTNYWSPNVGTPPWVISSTNSNFVGSYWLLVDPVPVIPQERNEVTTATKGVQITPHQVFRLYQKRMKRGDTLNALSAIIRFMRTDSSQHIPTAALSWLNQVHRQTKNSDLADAIIDLCASRTDLLSKLYASDLLADLGEYKTAIDLINAYSFAGNKELLRLSLLRKAMYYPRSSKAGYQIALKSVDSLGTLFYSDLPTRSFAEMYPLLFSNLTLIPKQGIKKATNDLVQNLLIPGKIELYQNYPNPFREYSAITFRVPEDMNIHIAIYDALGRQVQVFVSRTFNSGTHTLQLDAHEFPAGIYFYRMITKEQTFIKKFVVVK